VAQDDNKENQRDVVNAFISSVMLGEGKNKNTTTGEGPRRENLHLGSNQSSVVVEWLDGSTTTAGEGPSSEERRNWIAVAVYPEVAIRKLHGVDVLLSSLIRRYALYYEHHCSKQIHDQPGENAQYRNIQLAVPPQDEFDSAFHSILRRFQDQLAAANTSSDSISSLEKRPSSSVVKSNNKQQSQNATKKGKEKTVWHDGKQKITKAAFAELDMSKDKVDTLPGEQGIDGIREDARAITEAKAAYMPTEGEKPAWEEEDEVLDDFDIHWNTDKQDASEGEDDSRSPSGIRGFFSKLLSPNSPLAKSDLDSPLKQMQLLLTTKNVAPSTAQAICEVVEKQLLGKKVGTLVGVKRAVRHALEDAVERILSPELGGIGGRAGVARGKSVDVLRGVVEKRERRKSGGGLLGLGGGAVGKGQPYVIVMIGINGTFALFLLRRDPTFPILMFSFPPNCCAGVGKSTSLAKIAYYLKSNQCTPLLAACDTFRSGAVEQLSVHASCLSIPLYHQGYAKDPSAVAKAAISKAAEDGNDVVLVDTAGRMQNNLPLMKALAKLVLETQPDLVLFVCEALVGNDGMDQLTMFQKALTSGGHSRPIDGVVLTKFDTVSDKVGAALTLTHLTGVPIAFCGTGQKYNHLKPLSVPFVIHSLFS
jgi:signal recognition particle receptor subunit alpha